MGELNVKLASSTSEVQTFVRHVLNDIQAMEAMLKKGMFDDKQMHIGAEQELALVDKNYKPAPLSMEILERANNDLLTTELALFNLEFNLDPLPFKGDSISRMEKQINELYQLTIEHANALEGDVAMVGILPTIRKFDLGIENLTPLDRYHALVTAIKKLRGKDIELHLRGVDELILRHDSPILEACNTGFQMHLQVRADDFVNKYNVAQAITAPLMAISVNSPMLLGKRLWSETRLALFQQSIDTRSMEDHLRDRSPRVTFGNSWLKDSILEIYKEDISRFRVLLSIENHVDAFKELEEGRTPNLGALMVHNGTVYRWNRPCYGVVDGVPHLRIEARIFPAGPTVVDEMANGAFWLGLMNGFEEVYPDISKQLDFDIAKDNFVKAAMTGMDTTFTWVNDTKISAVDFIIKEMLPIARKGLEKANINKEDIDKYLGIIEERAKFSRTGARWLTTSYGELIKEGTKEEAMTAITAGMVKRQKEGNPVHTWDLADIHDLEDWSASELLVEELMTSDIFTVREDDPIELVADMMDWRKIRYIPVEDKTGDLVGLITSRMIMRNLSNKVLRKRSTPECVKDVMLKDPITISPEGTILEAIKIMDTNQIGCLPVSKNKKLIGVVTEANYMKITTRLIKRLARKKNLE